MKKLQELKEGLKAISLFSPFVLKREFSIKFNILKKIKVIEILLQSKFWCWFEVSSRKYVELF